MISVGLLTAQHGANYGSGLRLLVPTFWVIALDCLLIGTKILCIAVTLWPRVLHRAARL